MKKFYCLVIALGFIVSLSAQKMENGIWLTGNANTKIETYQKDGAWYGKVIASDNPKAKIGSDAIRDIKLVDGEWKGKIYIAKRDRLVDAVIDPGSNQLSVTISAMGRNRTVVWKKKE